MQYQQENLQTPMVNPQFQQMQQPQYGQPQYGQPQYGSPQYGSPQYGQPQPLQQVVVVQQQVSQEPSKQYYKGLCSCCENCDTCLIGYCCAHFCALQIMHSLAVQKATQGRIGCCVPCLLELVCCPCINRQTIRNEYKIMGDICTDCLLFYFCAFCAYLQDVNEVNYRIANNLTGQ